MQLIQIQGFETINDPKRIKKVNQLMIKSHQFQTAKIFVYITLNPKLFQNNFYIFKDYITRANRRKQNLIQRISFSSTVYLHNSFFIKEGESYTVV